MTEIVKIHSFGPNDRSGKVRWLAYELGLAVENINITLGENRQYPFRALNPYAAIPVVEWRDQTMIESTAICTYIAEQFPDSGLIVAPVEADRLNYLQWLAVGADTLEAKLVEYFLSKRGIMPEDMQPLYERTLAFKLRVVLEQLPESGFLAADRLTIADITMAYCLRLAINGDLIRMDQVEGYLAPLMERQAAKDAKFFGSITG